MASRTVVGTSVSRVIDDRLLPNSIKAGTLKGILSGDQLVENILEDLIGCVGVRAERMYGYGKDGYVYGLPNSVIHKNTLGVNQLEDVIGEMIGKPVTIIYNYHSPLNNLHYCWKTLCESYGYNPATNEIESLRVGDYGYVYLLDIQVVVADATDTEILSGSLNQWGIPPKSGYAPSRPVQVFDGDDNLRTHTPYVVDPSALADYFIITYQIHGDIRTFTIPMTTVDPNPNHFQALYSYDIELLSTIPSLAKTVNQTEDIPLPYIVKTKQYGYFTYKDGEGTYPSLDEIYTTEHTGLGSFFPRAYFRFGKQPVSTDANSEEYKSTKKLLKYLGMDYADVTASINENPDIADVESAFLTFAVPANTTNPLEQRYLFEFFKTNYIAGVSGGVFNENFVNGKQVNNPRNHSIVIEDARFKIGINFADLNKKYKVGSIGPVGSFSSSIETQRVSEFITSLDLESSTGYTTTEQLHDYPVFCYQKQISTGVYEEIRVVNLTTTYFIWGSYADMADGIEPTLLIPLDHSITDKYTVPQREKLYARSLHFVFNSRVTTKIKWYQTGLFQMILIVVAVIITVLIDGADGGSLIGMAAAGTLTLEILVMKMVVALILGVIAHYAFKLFVKLVGPKWGMVIAVVAAVYSLGSQGSTTVFGTEGLPWASQMLSVSTGLMNAVTADLKEEMIGLYKEQQEFNLFAQDQYKELEDMNKILNHNNWMAPFIALGEKPQDYYYRTCHIGNPGAVCIDMIHNYADYALRKPSFSDSLRMGGLMDVA